MTLATKSFSQFVADMGAVWASYLDMIPALSPGDPVLATFEATSGQIDFLQNLAISLLNLTRATTSENDDLDTWMAQWAFPRLSATKTTGIVVFGKLSPGVGPVSIPAAILIDGVYQGGVLVQLTGGVVQYQVVPDANQPTYDSLSNTYVLATGQTSLSATVECLVAGIDGNITDGQISQIASNLPGIDTVTNLVSFTNGKPKETDDAYRERFRQFIASLSKATRTALLTAINSSQQGLLVSLTENVNGLFTPDRGSFVGVVDDGSGAPPLSLLTRVYQAVDVTRAFTIQPYIIPPTLIQGTIILSVRIDAGFNSVDVLAAVKSAVATAVNLVPSNSTTYIVATIEAAALGVPGVISVKPNHTAINAVQDDYVSDQGQSLRVTVNSVFVDTY